MLHWPHVDITHVPFPALRHRRDQVESLHLQGCSTDEIAAKLRLPIWTVRRDLRAVEKDRLTRTARNIARERLRSIAVHRHTQRVGWELIQRLMDNDDLKPIVTYLRAISAAEKEVDAILRSFADSGDHGPGSIRDLFAAFTPAELEAELESEAARSDPATNQGSGADDTNRDGEGRNDDDHPNDDLDLDAQD